MNKYCKVENGKITYGPKFLPNAYGNWSTGFANITEEEKNAEGFYLAIEEPIGVNQKRGEPIIAILETVQVPNGEYVVEKVEVIDEEGNPLVIEGVTQYTDINVPQYDDFDIMSVTYPAIDKTQEEIDTEIAAIIHTKEEQLWQVAHDYEYHEISGSAIGMLTSLTMAGNIKGIAVQMWIKSIWSEYYTRKAAITIDPNADIDTDFSVAGAIPHTVPELLVEYEALLSV